VRALSPAAIALIGGDVRTLDQAGTRSEAILVCDGLVAAVGTSRDVLARASAAAEVVDLGGRTVLPGMIDAHAHVELSALAETEWIDVRAVGVATTLARITAAARERARGEWLVVQGTFGQALPSREELDSAAPGVRVVVRESMHHAVASSAALRAAGIDRRFVEPAGTRVQRSPGGEPTGVVEEGFDLFGVPWPDRTALRAALRRTTAASWVRHGVSAIHELPASAAAIDAWRGLAADGELPCRIVLNPILAPGHQPTALGPADVVALRHSLGRDSWLTTGALKLFVDGAGAAALTREQLAGPPAGWGLAPFSYASLRRVLADCRDASVQVWMHAVGDLAQELALDAVEQTNRTHPVPDHRTRIEHVGNAVCDPAALRRLAPAGIVPVPTASFMHRYRETPHTTAREGNVPFPFATMLRLGLEPPGNSDSAGTQPFATSPWHGVCAAIDRHTGDGRTVPPPDEAIDVDAAVRMWTRFAARATLTDGQGALVPGAPADLAVYSRDPYRLEPDELRALEADLTLVGGRIVHHGARAPRLPDHVSRRWTSTTS
jgi:predicted amidohydrolase YtcJ